MRRMSSQRGLTLLELVIGLTLLGLIMAVLSGGLRLASQAWERGAAQADRNQQIELVRDWLRRQLAHARPVAVRSEDGGSAPALSGERTHVRFVAPLPAHLGGGGLSWIELAESTDRSGDKQLVLTHRLFHPDLHGDIPPELIERRVLLEGLESVAIDYFGRPQLDEPLAWREEWSVIEYLPNFIRIAIRFDAGSPHSWQPLVVGLPVDGGTRPNPYFAPAERGIGG